MESPCLDRIILTYFERAITTVLRFSGLDSMKKENMWLITSYSSTKALISLHLIIQIIDSFILGFRSWNGQDFLYFWKLISSCLKCTVQIGPMIVTNKQFSKIKNFWAVTVTQLAERLLLTPVICSSNPVNGSLHGNNYFMLISILEIIALIKTLSVSFRSCSSGWSSSTWSLRTEELEVLREQ